MFNLAISTENIAKQRGEALNALNKLGKIMDNVHP